MTDLNLAYGILEDNSNDEKIINKMQISQMNDMDIDKNNIIENNNNDNIIEKKVKKKVKMNDYEERPLQQRYLQKENYNLPQNISNDSIPEYPYAKKNINQQNNVQMSENNFWNRFTSKKGEVFKLIMFSFVILFAISLDRISTYYLSKYVNENVLTDNQEFIIRLSYPVIIILILWFFKAL